MRPFEDDENLEIIRDNLRLKWPQLTDDDLQYKQGEESAFVRRIQERTGESAEAVEKRIAEARITGDVC